MTEATYQACTNFIYGRNRLTDIESRLVAKGRETTALHIFLSQDVLFLHSFDLVLH